MTYKEFAQLVSNKAEKISNEMKVFQVDATKKKIKSIFVNAFPEDTRQGYNCTACKSWVYKVGTMVGIDNDANLHTVWDVYIPEDSYYHQVAKVMREHIKSLEIREVYIKSIEDFDGFTIGSAPDVVNWHGNITPFNHFKSKLNYNIFVADKGDKKSNYEGRHSSVKNGLEEMSLKAIRTVKDLATSNQLHRGDSFMHIIDYLEDVLEKHESYDEDKQKRHCWLLATESASDKGWFSDNTSIVQLLRDLGRGVNKNRALELYKNIVSNSTYMMPTTGYNQSDGEKAINTIETLGLSHSMQRRHLDPLEIPVDDIYWKRLPEVKVSSIESLILSGVKKDYTPDKHAEEITIEDFISDVVPSANDLEMFVAASHEGNLMNMTTAVNENAPHMFLWDNPVSWSFMGDVAGAVKTRAKSYGASVDGNELVCTLAWGSRNDLDLTVIEKMPSGEKYNINYQRGDDYSNLFKGIKASRVSPFTKGELDLDMNGVDKNSDTPAENIFWKEILTIPEGTIFDVFVHNYGSAKEMGGFTLVITNGYDVTTLNVSHAIRGDEKIKMVQMMKKGNKIIVSDPNGNPLKHGKGKTTWGINLNTWQKVDIVTTTPNYWGENNTGQKHWCFISNNLKNPNPVRGFYNENLNGELKKHRKVFDSLGDKTRAEYSNTQTSGLGFSHTQRDSVNIKIDGKQYKIKF